MLSKALFLLFLSTLSFATTAEQDFKALLSNFVADYKALKVPNLEYAYVDNLKKIKSLPELSQQKQVIHKYKKLLRKIDCSALSFPQQLEYKELAFQLDLNHERINLEKDFKKHAPAIIPDTGLSKVRNAKRWYHYFLRRWTSTHLAPHKLLQFGQAEVARVKSEMAKIQKELGFEGKDEAFYQHLNSDAFYLTDEKKLIESFKTFREQVKSDLHENFEVTEVPEVDVKPIPDVNKDSPPGYYTNNTFFFNFYQNKFPKRAFEWLFIHEAIPGHHYQGHVGPAASSLKDVFSYPSFAEGWAVYMEDIGKDLKTYEDPYMYYGKWEWDLVRSARIVLDVGINYFGWSRDEASKYWRENIPNQEWIREREINRIHNWPLQVLAYKLGEKKFIELREKSKTLGYDQKKFNTQVIQYGDMPLDLLDSVIR